MIVHSLRWRLQVWHGLLLVVVLAGFGLFAYHAARENQFRRIDQELEQHLNWLMRPFPGERERGLGGPGPIGIGERPARRPGGPNPETPGPRPNRPEPAQGFPGGQLRQDAPPGFVGIPRLIEAIKRAGPSLGSQTNEVYFILWRTDGSVIAASSNAPPNVPLPERPRPAPVPGQDPDRKDGPPPMQAVAQRMVPGRLRGEAREVMRFLPRGECLLAGRNISADLSAMRRLGWWMGAAGLGVLALGLAGGWWLAARAIRPIDAISAAASRIAEGDLSRRIDAAETDSELGRLAAVLNSTFARLEAAFAHQARFTSDASHELRTPVTVILTQTQSALSRERQAGEYRHALEACQRAAQRMRNLIESLLELARLDAGREAQKHERVQLDRVAAETVELVRPLADERGLRIFAELEAVASDGDPGGLAQVFTNLLTNAIHFNRENGEVRLATRAENGAAVVVVSDTGQGIPSEDLPHIFERFYRVDKSRSRVQGRTGLGLAICKAIVEGHGGTIEAVSHPGAGSAFTVRLPLKP